MDIYHFKFVINMSVVNFFKQFKTCNPSIFLSKDDNRKMLEILTENIWFEFIYKLFKLDNNLNFEIKNVTSFSDYLKKIYNFEYNKKSLIYLEKITNYNKIQLPENFAIVCIDEYINGRKKGSYVFKNNKFWNNNSWKKLEEIFEIIIFQLKYEKKDNLLIFLLMESFRYDLISQIFIEKDKYENKNKLIKRWIKNFFLNRHLIYFYEFSKNWIKNKHNENISHIHKSLGNYNLIKLIHNFFHNKKAGVKYKLIKFLLCIKKKNSSFYFSFSGRLFRTGLINKRIFWFKHYSRDFLSVLRSIYSGLLFKEMTFIITKENNKLFTKLNLKTFIHTKDLQKWCENSNLTKIAFVFLINVLITNSKNSCDPIDFLYSIEYKKVNSWLKFLTGFCFSISQRWNFKFFQTFLNLIEKKWLSEYLKGGILFGMGMNLKDLTEFKELFLEKYFNILKNGSYFEENKYHMVRNGAYLGISLSTGIQMKSQLKYSFLNTLISNIAMTSKTEDPSVLSFGLYLQNDSSKYILKNLLKMTNIVRSEKMIKFVFFSISLIYKNNKEVAEHLFEKLYINKNSTIRSGAINIGALAFTGSCNLRITDKFLQVISSDLDDDVKKTSIISLGFLFFSKFFLLEKIILQFINHFNPFIRYGACYAIGISCFYKNSYCAMELLQKLSNDKIDFVRQGSFISLGLCSINDQNRQRKKEIKTFFEKKLIDNNHTEISRFGILLGYALTEININKSINKNLYDTKDLTGIFLFIQHWYWLPFILFIFFLF